MFLLFVLIKHISQQLLADSSAFLLCLFFASNVDIYGGGRGKRSLLQHEGFALISNGCEPSDSKDPASTRWRQSFDCLDTGGTLKIVRKLAKSGFVNSNSCLSCFLGLRVKCPSCTNDVVCTGDFAENRALNGTHGHKVGCADQCLDENSLPFLLWHQFVRIHLDQDQSE